MTSLITRALISGTTAAAMSAIAAGIAGRRINGSYAAPINATSHIVWGEKAARQNSSSLKYTGMGVLLNYGGSVFWALLYEGLMGKHRSPGRALLRSGIITTTAYITDYYLIPRRFTPGFEKRLPGRFLTLIYAAFGLGLAANDLLPPASTFKVKTTQAIRSIRSYRSFPNRQPTIHYR